MSQFLMIDPQSVLHKFNCLQVNWPERVKDAFLILSIVNANGEGDWQNIMFVSTPKNVALGPLFVENDVPIDIVDFFSVFETF